MDGNESPLVFEAFAGRVHEITLDDLEIFGHRAIFESVGARNWIEKHRIPRIGALDIEATTQSLGVPLRFEEDGLIASSGRTLGLQLQDINEDPQPLAIQIRPDLPPGEASLTFGHEIGHIFLELETNAFQYEYSHKVEDFCELFGREMVLPRRELEGIAYIDEAEILKLTERYNVEVETVLFQLIEASKLPRKLIISSKVPSGSRGKHAGKVVDSVFCFDCSEVEYESCEKVPSDSLRKLDFSHLELVGSLRHCGNHKHWAYDSDEDEQRDKIRVEQIMSKIKSEANKMLRTVFDSETWGEL